MAESSKCDVKTFMDILTVLEAARAPLTIDEIKEYSGPMFSPDRLESLTRSGEIKKVQGCSDIYFIVPPSMKKNITARKCQSPMKQTERKKCIQQIIDLRNKIVNVSQEIDSLMAKKDQFPTQEQLTGHMNRLHQYNDNKDIGQMILSHLAQIDNVTIQSLYEEYNLDSKE